MFAFRFPQFPSFLDSSSVYRFVRVIVAAALAALFAAAIENLGILGLPDYIVPVITAALVAIDKFLRDYFGS